MKKKDVQRMHQLESMKKKLWVRKKKKMDPSLLDELQYLKDEMRREKKKKEKKKIKKEKKFKLIPLQDQRKLKLKNLSKKQLIQKMIEKFSKEELDELINKVLLHQSNLNSSSIFQYRTQNKIFYLKSLRILFSNSELRELIKEKEFEGFKKGNKNKNFQPEIIRRAIKMDLRGLLDASNALMDI